MRGPKLTRRKWIGAALASLFAGRGTALFAANYRRIPTKYIAALAPEGATSGSGAETWGIWHQDPGPIGVWLKYYQALRSVGGIGPTGWRFDIDDWWLDENGLIMKAPEFPISAGQYYVTNGEEHIALLTVDPPDEEGRQSWSLSDDKTIANVTHGPCRSARYTPVGETETCSPENANRDVFPLKPGESPPLVSGCRKKDYAVLIVFGVPVAG
ncbi:hypothetical protein [Roseovarius sp. EL26]|uniref:hypothetical protein n=1 Tax=Roseovarius sp. EL26 TaxID=2126672 RepID=UPI000EA01A84|nr:hypothetical protein [Roseovarius sp. EL26]